MPGDVDDRHKGVWHQTADGYIWNEFFEFHEAIVDGGLRGRLPVRALPVRRADRNA